MHSAPAVAHAPATAVHLSEVTKTYPDGPVTVRALNQVSLGLRSGSFTAVMGPSGSGKSTLLNCIAGLETPDSGRILIGDVEVTRLSGDALTRFRRDHVGFIFQSYNLIDHLTVVENIRLPLMLAGRKADPEWEKALIHAVHLNGKEHRLPSGLSGGQAQRVAIARAMITRPSVIFADEPTGALDSHTGQEILELLRKTAASVGQTVVLVTHDARIASAAEQVLFLADGSWAGHLVAPTPEEITSYVMELGT
ncbi:ABC transporter ATP-binding protein [Nesterenkonia rhizosphaerae]|uniref:ABC transporter ATP-binding protein n=1 Tax=Nesterenkonia rhizosphaerae TaxID=1348272 RepID=A0ABP9FX87_9MICC